MRIVHSILFSIIISNLVEYPTPTVGYLNSLGFLLGCFLFIQIITGIFLATQYAAHVNFSFFLIENIIRNVNDGWVFRYFHSNGASFFFFFCYCHIFNNCDQETDDLIWISGTFIFIVMMATAFMGYILPWGQMSFWGATVITNLFTAIPWIGSDISQWLWGGFSISNPTLNRFFSFHYLLPFILISLVFLHLTILHTDESDNFENEYIEFFYFYIIKDFFIFIIVSLFFLFFVFFKPNFLGHPDNYIPAIITTTPAHLVPEWYFLPFYASLRSVPDKFGGLICLLFSLFELTILIDIFFLNKKSILENFFFDKWVFFFDWIEDDDDDFNVLLSFFLGSADIEEPYVDFSSLLTIVQIIDFLNFFDLFNILFNNQIGDEDFFVE